jgi:hypothetical protein
MTIDVKKCYITIALWSKGNALSHANCSLLKSRLKHLHVVVHGSNSPYPLPSDTYLFLGVELNTALSFTKHWHELKCITIALINFPSTSLQCYSRRIRDIRGFLIDKYFTL